MNSSKSRLADPEIIVEYVAGEEDEELKRFVVELQRKKDMETEAKRTHRAEINRKIAEDKKKRKREKIKQLKLF